MMPRALLLPCLALAGSAFAFAPSRAPQETPAAAAELGPGPAWRGVRPAGRNEVFATGDGCALCHSAAPKAVAMRSPTGEDLSPHGLWQATPMGNAFRDPFWRAQMAQEVAAAPERQREIESSCLVCHAPMAHHSRRLAGLEPPTFDEVKDDALAQDGVSCTVCHQAGPDGLGEFASFGGNLDIERGRRIFGPHADPSGAPMIQHSAYTPEHGAHISESALCGSCHTLIGEHAGHSFPEQTPYLEWRNSSFSSEAGDNPDARSCQSCHMPEFGDTKIARNPGGRDFNIPLRPNYSAHLFVGGNAFLLDMLRENAEELGVSAPPEALERMALATRRQLAEKTTRVAIEDAVRKDGELSFTVAVENLTGHKFPSGYPARRAWLEVDVRAGRDVLFASGAADERGRIQGVDDESALPHVDRIRTASEVLVWELVALDDSGEPTTLLSKMATRAKDNRLLPKGWRADGPHTELTAPVGTDGDSDFGAGGDRAHFTVPIGDATGPLRVVAWVRYQAMPPSWVDPLRKLRHPHAEQFVRFYDAADPRPETAGLAVIVVPGP